MIVLLPCDENGWAVGAISPLPVSECFSLFSPEGDSRFDAARVRAQAERFFKADVSLLGEKRYPQNSWPVCDALRLEVTELGRGETSQVIVQTVPMDRAGSVRAAAERAVERLGGAGFDVLLRRAKRLWQVQCALLAGSDRRAALVVAAVLASHWLAPILSPDDESIFGVRGARERLDRGARRA